MSKLFVDDKGRILSSDKVEFAGRIFKLKAKKDSWAVIDELIKYWLSSSPEEVQAIKINISDSKEILVDKKYGQTKGGKDMERRFQLIFPTSLQALIRSVYKADELLMNRQFYRSFAKRYPGFKVAEKN